MCGVGVLAQGALGEGHHQESHGKIWHWHYLGSILALTFAFASEFRIQNGSCCWQWERRLPLYVPVPVCLNTPLGPSQVENDQQNSKTKL